MEAHTSGGGGSWTAGRCSRTGRRDGVAARHDRKACDDGRCDEAGRRGKAWPQHDGVATAARHGGGVRERGLCEGILP